MALILFLAFIVTRRFPPVVHPPSWALPRSPPQSNCSSTMLMVQKNQSDRHSPHNDCKQGPDLIPTSLDNALNSRNSLTGGNVEVHASRHGKDDTCGLIGGVGGEENNTSQANRQSRDEVEHASLEDG